VDIVLAAMFLSLIFRKSLIKELFAQWKLVNYAPKNEIGGFRNAVIMPITK
jgi:hypothetical protein